MSARLFPLGMMLALALLTFYLQRTVSSDDSPPALRRHDPDYLVVNFTTTTYNRDGAAETVLSAARMVHYPDDDTTELFEPRMLQSKPDQPRFTVRAARGQLSRDGEEVFLYDDVLVVREATPERAEARMSTEFLHVLRERSLVRTDKAVKYVEGPRIVTGRGMEYDNVTRELLLRHDVKARFAPSDATPPAPATPQ